MNQQQLALAIQINDEATLTNFNWHNNELLQQQLELMLHHKSEKILYLWGPEGCGKSHLLQACCQAIQNMPSAIYLPLAILQEWGPQSLEGVEEQNLICIDDVDAIASNKEWEEALFHLYNKVKDKENNLLLLSGIHSPIMSRIQLADLRSRLSWGLVIQVHELNDEGKIDALKKLALQRGFELTPAVCQFLVNHYSRNMHDLHQMLDKLDKASLQAHRKITIPFVKDILGLTSPSNKKTLHPLE